MALNDWDLIISHYKSAYSRATALADHATAILRLIPLVQNELSGLYTEFGTSHSALFLVNEDTQSGAYVFFEEGLYHVHSDADSQTESCDFDDVINVIRQFLTK